MRVCDRCRMPNPKYYNVYIGHKNRDMCNRCNKEYEKLDDVFKSIEETFMDNKNLKQVDLQWEDK